jgi:hypothetical protein
MTSRLSEPRNIRPLRTAITRSTSRPICWIRCTAVECLHSMRVRIFLQPDQTKTGQETSRIYGPARAGCILQSSSLYSPQVIALRDLHANPFRVTAWAVSNRMKRDLAIRALDMAVALRQPPKGCMHHTDRGSQYCFNEYQRRLSKHGFNV